MIKKISILFIVVFSIALSYGQNAQKERKLVKVDAGSFVLNSINNSVFWTGKNKKYININLPPYTVEWCYEFWTVKGETARVTLFDQIASMDIGLSIANMAIKTMSGTGGVCDVYLTDKENANKFYQDKHFFYLNERFVHKQSASGMRSITNLISNNLSLCFCNAHSTNQVKIAYEIVAIVDEGKFENEAKAETFGSLGWKAYEKGEYEKCLELSKKAVELNPNLGWAHNNMGLVYLIKGDYISAVDSYSTAIACFLKSDKPKYWANEAVKDLNALVAKHGQLEGVSDILEMFK